MATTAEAPAREKPMEQMVIPAMSGSISTQQDTAQRVHVDLKQAIPPFAAACGLIGVTALVQPAVPLGIVMIGGVAALGGISLYNLWPRNQ